MTDKELDEARRIRAKIETAKYNLDLLKDENATLYVDLPVPGTSFNERIIKPEKKLAETISQIMSAHYKEELIRLEQEFKDL